MYVYLAGLRVQSGMDPLGFGAGRGKKRGGAGRVGSQVRFFLSGASPEFTQTHPRPALLFHPCM